jgi:D-glycero-alpha-D-manno-heptose-7-phosphate kinase
MIISMTPYRISFFGGGTDYPLWYRENGGEVLSTTINKYCYITCRYLPPFFKHRHRFVYSEVENVVDTSTIKHPSIKAVLEWLEWEKGLEIHHDGDLPARSGLGSSSSFTVGLLNVLTALQGGQISKKELACRAIHIEQDIIKEAVGSQDQIASAYGGFNKIEFQRDNSFNVHPVILTTEKKKYFESHLMLFFTGISRYAVEAAKSKIKNISNRKKELTRIGQTVEEALNLINSTSDFAENLGQLMHEAWLYKRSLSNKVTNKTIDEIYEAAREAGAYGGKLMGAGNGGFMVFLVKPELQEQVRERLKSLTYVPFEFENFGSKIALYQPNGLG